MNPQIVPDYARTARMNLFDAFDAAAVGDHVRVETDDGRTFEGDLVNVEIKLARDAWFDANALVATFERADGHRMRLSQFSDGVSLSTEWDDPHTRYESFRDLDGSPEVAAVAVENAEDDDEDLGEPSIYGVDEFNDELPRENCANCGGEVAHVETRRPNSWINEASAYDAHLFECLDCGRRGERTEHGDRTGVLAFERHELGDDERLLA